MEKHAIALKEKVQKGGIFASGQHTIMEGYAALKMMKGGFRSTQLVQMQDTVWHQQLQDSIKHFGIDEPKWML